MSSKTQELLKLARKIAEKTPEERLEEIQELSNRGKEAAIARFNMEDVLFDKQLEVFRSKSRKKVLVCSRRSGKSTFIAADMLITAMENPRTTQMYVGLTKASAKLSMEEALVNFIADYQLPCKLNKNTMRIDFQNGSKILIEGAKDGAAVERLRGGKLLKAIVDEAQSFPTAFALNLLSSVIAPALGDLGGTLIISGTPDPLCKSVLHMAFNGTAPFANYDKFSWNTTHNKKFPLFVRGEATPEQYLQSILADTGMKATDPTFRREYLGEFVEDRESLAYGFHPDRDLAPELPKGHEWNYVVSFDAGFVDSDAIVCMAFSYTCKTAYVVECYSMAKQDISSLMDKVVYFQQKYEPIKVIGDPAGGGAKMVSELNNRYGIAAKVAEKFNPKLLGVKLVGSDFRAGLLKVVDCEENDLLVAQLSSITIKIKQDRQGNFVQYVPDGKCVVNEDGVVGDDCADAMLYAFKFCRNHYAQERYDESPEERTVRIISEHKQQIAVRDVAEAYAAQERSWF
jgi:hypothetical protein